MPELVDILAGLPVDSSTSGTEKALVLDDGALKTALNSSAAINLGSLAALTPDGVTDNLAAFNTAKHALKTVGESWPVTCALTIASPCEITVDMGGYIPRVNAAFKLSTSDALPSGVTAGTSYFIISEGLAVDGNNVTFRFSTDDALAEGAEGSAVVSTGSQNGTHKITFLGEELQRIVLPPGRYHTSTFATLQGGQAKLDLEFGGAVTDNLNFSTLGLANDWDTQEVKYAPLTADAVKDTHTAKVADADADKFPLGQCVAILALDLQNSLNSQLSTPPSNQYFEFNRIVGKSSAAGETTLTLKYPLQDTYKITYPLFYGGSESDPVARSGGGPATVFAMNPEWDMEMTVRNLHHVGNGVTDDLITSARRIHLIGGAADGGGPYPTMTEEVCYEDFVWGTKRYGRIEVDKLIGHAAFIRCQANEIAIQSASNRKLTVDAGSYEYILGSVRNTLLLGPIIKHELRWGPTFFGASETYTAIGVTSPFAGDNPRLDDPLANSAFNNFVNKYTFDNGTFRIPMASAGAKCNNWAVPGRWMVVNDMAGQFKSMGSPFQILDVYEDADDFCFDTTLNAAPVGPTTSQTVTITIATPGVVSWTGHGLPAGTPVTLTTTDALPTGLAVDLLYYVASAGLGADSFRLAATVGGSAINTTGSQSGTHTAYANPLHFQPISVPQMYLAGCSGCKELVDHSSPKAWGKPPWSYAARQYAGNLGTDAQFIDKLHVRGNLVSLSVDVKRASAAPLEMTITADVFDDLIHADFELVINLEETGKRVLTPSGASGAETGDTHDDGALAAEARWFSGDVTIVYSDTVANLDDAPVVDIEFETDQGVRSITVAAGPTQAHPERLSLGTVG